MVKDVFLGGTCNGSMWRNEIIPLLKVSFFNPVVDNWTPECQAEEVKQRKKAKIVLYTITPKMTGFYSIAEVVDDSNKRPRKTVLCILEKDDGQEFTKHQLKSLNAVAKMVNENGVLVFYELETAAEFINEVIKNNEQNS